MDTQDLPGPPIEFPPQDPLPVQHQGVSGEMLQEDNGPTAPLEGATDEVPPQLLLQRESYHGTNQPLVQAEGPSGTQALGPVEEGLRSTVDHAAKEFEDSSVLGGMERFSAKEGPVKFQMWQSTFYRLLREGLVDTEAIPGEEKSSLARRMKESYESIQTDLHGPDHRLQAVRMAQEQAARHCTTRIENAPRQQDTEGARLAEEQKKAVRPSSRPSARERELRSMSANRLLTTQEMDEHIPSGTATVGRFPRRTATREPPDLRSAEGERPEEFVMHTPRGTHAVRKTSPDSPDHLLFDEEAMGIWREHAASGTEDTEEMDRRLEELCGELGVHPEARNESIEFVVRIEQLTPEYRFKFGRWLASDKRNHGIPMGQFAEEQTANLRAEEFQSLTELKAHVYTLGALMKRDPAVSRALAMDLWESSRDSESPEGGRESPNQDFFGTAGETDQRMETDGEPQGQPPNGSRAAGLRRFASLSTIGEHGDLEDSGAQEEPGFPSERVPPPNVRRRREDEQPLWEDGSSREVRSSTPLAGRSHLPHPYVVRTGRYRSPGEPDASTPGARSDRPSEAADVVNAMTAGMKTVVDSMFEKFKESLG